MCFEAFLNVRTFSLDKVRENCHFLDHPPTPRSLRNIKMAPIYKVYTEKLKVLDRIPILGRYYFQHFGCVGEAANMAFAGDFFSRTQNF